MNENIYCILGVVIVECGKWFFLARNMEEATSKREEIIFQLRIEHCTHKVKGIIYDEIPKSMVKQYNQKLKKLYFLYAGNCAFGL